MNRGAARRLRLVRAGRLLAALLMLVCTGALTARADTVTVFAAASLRDALDSIAEGFATETGHDVVVSAAGTSALARQIQFGAPADVFVSASSDWMDLLQSEGLIRPGTRFDLAANRLVLVGHEPGGPGGEITAGFDLAGTLGQGRLAMALTDAVPAGIYGRRALEHLGHWDTVSAQVAQVDNVRAALALVALGEAPLGIVYATDAMAEPRVHLRGSFAPESHPPILYPVAAISDRAVTRAFLEHLRSGPAREALRALGFGLPEG